MRTDLLQSVSRIYTAARESADGELCCVAPHPDLQEQLVEQLDTMRRNAPAELQRLVKIQEPTRVGFNDGLLIPGDLLPLGTPPSLASAFGLNRAPLRGDLRVIVVLVDFSDQEMVQTQQHYEELFFSVGVLPNGSVREYFTEVTNGLVTITGEVVGPYRLPRTMAGYANGAAGTGSTLPNARTMARDAAEAANPDVNFAPYDNDDNGYVDAFVVVHAGPAGEVTGNSGHIWSHKWVLSGGEYNADGTRIFAYLTVDEDCRIGVCAHELGHLLFGFPDLYDTDYSSSGVGNWCLMGGGSWNGGGNVPAHPSAYCKANQGWVSTVNLTTNSTVSLPDVKTSRQVHRLWKDGAAGNEYFLVENRQRTGYDRDLPGDGLLIWHIDEAISSNSDERHPRVALEQADGHNHLATGANRGDGGDPYPGSSGNTAFTGSSNPSSRSYAGAETCVSVTAISASAATMTARIQVRCRPVKRNPDKLALSEKLLRERPRKRFDREKLWIAEKQDLFDKRPEKPQIDKSQGYDKNPQEKLVDTPGGWRPQGDRVAGAGNYDDLVRRVEELEEALQSLSPFIGEDLRPDLKGSGQSDEQEADLNARLAAGDHSAKRMTDTKLPDV